METINLDHGAATPVDPAVLEAMLPFFTEHFGNPSGQHRFAGKPVSALAEARLQVARLIHTSSEEIIFTSCASESNNTALKGIARAYKKKGNHIIASSIEHFSILNPLKTLQKEGVEVTLLPVDRDGVIDPMHLAEAINDKTILVSIAAANPEIGTVQDISSLAAITRERGALFHTDATAAAGWIALDVERQGVDLLTLAGDQFFGPKGAAALYIRKGLRLPPLLEGGIQEKGLRAGTENVPALVGLGEAARLAVEQMPERSAKMAALRDDLKERLFAAVPHLHLNGHPILRLPRNLHISVEFVEGEALLMHLDMAGIQVSSGSSCASQALKSSHVLSAVGVSPELAQGSLLFTLGLDNSAAQFPRVAKELARIAAILREMSPLYHKFLEEGNRNA